MKTWRRSDEHYTCRLSRIRFIASLSDDDLFFFRYFSVRLTFDPPLFATTTSAFFFSSSRGSAKTSSVDPKVFFTSQRFVPMRPPLASLNLCDCTGGARHAHAVVLTGYNICFCISKVSMCVSSRRHVPSVTIGTATAKAAMERSVAKMVNCILLQGTR